MAEESANKEFDLVIFGASGVTGAYVAEELAKIAEHENVKWAIAGRSRAKLLNVLTQISVNTGMPLAEIVNTPIIIADVSDLASLDAMAKRAKVVLNCVGPYRFFGDQVVQACVNNSTSHLDVSGEPQFLEKTQLKYHQKAEEAGIYIIGTCGFDSIPCDMGITHLKQKFDGDLNSIETVLMMKPGGTKQKKINFGTWQSAVHGIGHINEMRAVRRDVNKTFYSKPMPKRNFPLKKRRLLSQLVDGWCFPFLGSDKSVCVRTLLYNYEHFNERPYQIQCYYKMKTLLTSLLTIAMVLFFAPLCFFSFGRSLLERFPEFFSFGYFTKQGPTREEVKDDRFTLEIYGYGWPEKLEDPLELHTEAPTKNAKVLVQGPDPAYVTTAICLVHSGICVLKEKNMLPSSGGVLTPGSAFAKTSLITRLHDAGLTFTYFNI